MLFFMIFFWFITAILGDHFFEKKLPFGLNPFFIFIFLCCCYFILKKTFIKKNYSNLNKKDNNQDSFKFDKRSKQYIICCCIYFILSLFNLANVWGIDNLDYSFSYAIRHCYFVVGFVISVSFYYSLCSKKNRKISNSNYLLYFYLFVSWIFKLLFKSTIIMFQPFTLFLSMYIYINNPKKFNFILYLLTLFISFNSMFSYIIANLVFFIIIFFPKLVSLTKNKVFSLFFKYLLVIFGIVIIFNYNKYLQFLSHDANTLWRWQVWTNEFNNLQKTYFTGVGFGTAYVDYNIFDSINNYNMYLDSGVQSSHMLLVVANHNSFVNMFYRMGIIGGTLFISCFVELLKWFNITYRKINNKQSRLKLRFSVAFFLYNTTIILLNPGIESPRFFLGFAFSLGYIYYILKTSVSYAKEA